MPSGPPAFGEPDLQPLVARVRGGLRAMGVGHGHRVGWQLAPSREAVALHLAILDRGAVSVPLFARATVRERERAQEAVRWTTFVNDAPLGEPIDAQPDLRPDALVFLLATSGTTGVPKWVPWTRGMLAATLDPLHTLWGWRRDDRLLHVLPLHHVHGLVVALHGALRAGATVVFRDARSGDALAHALRDTAATVFMGVPTHYRRLLDAQELDFPALRLCTSGSAPLPAAVHDAFARRTGRTIVERYGMTEIGMAFSNAPSHPRPGSVGRPLPGVRHRIVQDDGSDVVPGDVGELWVAGPGVFHGYLDRPQDTAASRSGPWTRTGDLGRMDADGFLHLVGRRGDRIGVGGFEVSPAEVEAVLAEVPGVHEVAVVGVDDADLGAIPVAAYVGIATPIALGAAADAGLSPYKRPRHYVPLDAIPRNDMGKLDRAALRASLTRPTIRQARPDEAERIATWNEAMARETEDLALDPATVRRGVRAVFDGHVDGRYFVAERLGAPVGQLMITREWSDWRAAHVWWIQSVYVLPAARRHGVYRALHDAAVAAAREAGAAGLRLYVDARNARAMATYASMGMDGGHYRMFESLFAEPPTTPPHRPGPSVPAAPGDPEAKP